MSIRTYQSARGHLLLYVGEPSEKSIVTLENYTKWYNIQVILPDGNVGIVDPAFILKCADECPSGKRWIDHLYHPVLLEKIAEKLDAELCERAHEVAAGRWYLESGCPL